jgi:hypothetical protein
MVTGVPSEVSSAPPAGRGPELPRTQLSCAPWRTTFTPEQKCQRVVVADLMPRGARSQWAFEIRSFASVADCERAGTIAVFRSNDPFNHFEPPVKRNEFADLRFCTILPDTAWYG